MILVVKRSRIIKASLIAALMVLLATVVFNPRGGAELVTAKPIYQGDENLKAMALTCNVFWGEEFIAPMLDILSQKEIKMTFFIGGTWAEKYPDLVKKIQAQGHEIGSHGYAHPHPDQLSVEANKRDIIKAEDIIKETTGIKPTLYAPPYGERGGTVLKAAEDTGYCTILWSVDTIDWRRPEPNVLVDRVLQKAHNGGIVLMHPTAPTVKALPTIIDGLKEDGYDLITVGEMLQTKANKK